MTEMNNIIANNLVEKDAMKVNLSASDSDVNQHVFFRKDKVTLRVKQISLRVSGITDSFAPGIAENGTIYDAGQLIKFDDDLGALVFDDPYTNWLDGTMGFWSRD